MNYNSKYTEFGNRTIFGYIKHINNIQAIYLIKYIMDNRVNIYEIQWYSKIETIYNGKWLK